MTKGKEICAHPGCRNEVEAIKVLSDKIDRGVYRPIARLSYCMEHIDLYPVNSNEDLQRFYGDAQYATIANNWPE